MAHKKWNRRILHSPSPYVAFPTFISKGFYKLYTIGGLVRQLFAKYT